MSDGRDEDLYADRSYRPGPPPELREPPRRRSRALGVFVATFALAAFAAVVWYAYDQGRQRGSEATAPLIRADPNPTKVRPEQPGGLQVPNQDKLVYDAMRPGDAAAPRVERLLPPPEKPVDPPAPPPLPQVSQAAPAAEANVPPPQESPAAGNAPAGSTSPPPAADDAIPPARIVAPAPTPRIPTPDETPAAPAVDARPVPAPAPSPPAPAATPAPTAAAEPSAQDRPAPENPAEKPAPARVAPGGFRIQLGALREQGAAEAEWARLQKRYPGELAGLEHRVQRVDLGPGKGVFFRIQSSGVSEASAGAICASLKTKGQPCIVVKP